MTTTTPQRLVNELTPRLARQKALARPVGMDIYLVTENWEVKVFEEDENIKKAESCMQLEECIKDPKTETIFIPENAAITKEKLFEIVERNSLKKTIFWEKDDEGDFVI
ncbi:MAG: hypothetical protein KAJ75_00185 [Alphaproteobacteria bacterium]|nr:hypothetical protein [Alphaproteobacteria bacterium]